MAQRTDIRLSTDALDLLRRTIKAHLNVEQSHEYLRIRNLKALDKENMSLASGFAELDTHAKGYLSLYDIEDIVCEFKRAKV